jgi:hypothetical protein
VGPSEAKKISLAMEPGIQDHDAGPDAISLGAEEGIGLISDAAFFPRLEADFFAEKRHGAIFPRGRFEMEHPEARSVFDHDFNEMPALPAEGSRLDNHPVVGVPLSHDTSILTSVSPISSPSLTF